MINKFLFLSLIFILVLTTNIAAQYTLPDVINDVRSQSDLSKISSLIDNEILLSDKNIKSKWYPQLSLNAQATYQSETSGLDIEFPGVSIDRLSKDQYKAQLEVGQILYDGGAISAMREINKLSLQIENEDININVEQVEKMAIEVFFAILETEERTNIIQLKLEEIAATITKIESLVTYGVMLESSLDELKIEELNAKQVLYELENNRINLIYTLSILTNKEYEENIKFVLPNDPLLASNVNNDLSVLNKLSLQKQSVLEANNLQATETVPKASLFAQAGYGKPGLNFLENQFSTYYLAGIRLNWNLSSFYNKGRNSEINSLKSQKLDALIDNQKSVLKSTIDNYNTQLLSNENQMENDKLILNMASDIKETAQYQLEQGVLDMSEYIQKLNIEKEAMVNQKLHKLKDLKLKYIINHVSGNLK